MIKFIKGAKAKSDYPSSDKEVVFVGRSNAGKSSLINCLYGKVAFVGKTPGKTKMLNFFGVDDKYTVCDVPGYGFANRSQDEIIEFGEMMEDYFSNRKSIKLCVQIVDIRHKPTKDDVEMYDYLKEMKIPVLLVANKVDKVSGNERVKSMKQISDTFNTDKEKIMYISCLSKINIDELKNRISLYL